MNYNSSLPDRSIGGESLLGGMLRQIKSVVDDEAATKFSLMTGSYDTFLAFFGIMGLPGVEPNFYGIPDYASTITFELYSEADNATFPAAGNVDEELLVRFLFRNGTEADSELTSYALGDLPVEESGGVKYGAFRNGLEGDAMSSVGEWCQRCGSQAEFCLSADATMDGETASSSAGNENGGQNSGLSAAAGGGIGAGVTLAVVAAVALLAWVMLRKRSSAVVGEKGSQDDLFHKSVSDSESV